MNSRPTLACPTDEAPSAADRIAACGLRVTDSRVQMLLAMERQTAPMTVEDLMRHLMTSGQSFSLGTVYRVLSDLANAGLLIRQWIDGVAGPRAIYLARANPAHVAPHRLICRLCRSELQFFSRDLKASITQSLGKDPLGSANDSLDILYCCPKCAEPA
ncbi:Fur family transcriptional regulator [Pandoraea sp. ISTKB]|uniref:Fur family transcriptional regulator n=1 Tax=Pandoraea sp. ISTKB TaxID=1586708 RepID=UPI000846FCD5|nr:transcriptional repressor [Pandoraea sp. ISTKB]ODP32883.1 hypothetical protein A9762_04155 [Pandoraea sp. ISTKB]